MPCHFPCQFNLNENKYRSIAVYSWDNVPLIDHQRSSLLSLMKPQFAKTSVTITEIYRSSSSSRSIFLIELQEFWNRSNTYIGWRFESWLWDSLDSYDLIVLPAHLDVWLLYHVCLLKPFMDRKKSSFVNKIRLYLIPCGRFSNRTNFLLNLLINNISYYITKILVKTEKRVKPTLRLELNNAKRRLKKHDQQYGKSTANSQKVEGKKLNIQKKNQTSPKSFNICCGA